MIVAKTCANRDQCGAPGFLFTGGQTAYLAQWQHSSYFNQEVLHEYFFVLINLPSMQLP